MKKSTFDWLKQTILLSRIPDKYLEDIIRECLIDKKGFQGFSDGVNTIHLTELKQLRIGRVCTFMTSTTKSIEELIRQINSKDLSKDAIKMIESNAIDILRKAGRDLVFNQISIKIQNSKYAWFDLREYIVDGIYDTIQFDNE